MAFAIFKRNKDKKLWKEWCENGLYRTEHVQTGVDYWRRWIICRLLNLFIYEGLDDGIDPREMELRALTEDVVGIIPANGKKYAVSVALSGYDAYYNPNRITWANPVLGGGTKEIGDKCAVLYCTSLSHDRNGHIPEMITRYATLIADAESSLTISLVNSRQMNLGVANDGNAAAAINTNFSKIREGEFAVTNIESLLDKFQTYPNAESTSHLSDFIYVRDNLMRALWSEMGIEYIQQKRTVTIDAEVGANGATLDCALVDMFIQRLEFVKMYNKVFGANAKVYINPIYMQRGEDVNEMQTNE